MGVYHLMGLGRSPGAVVGPITYLAHRYQRWNEEDKQFFSLSGEVSQRKRGDKVGDVQGIIFFSTREVLSGELLSFEYVENPAGKITQSPKRKPEPIKKILRKILKKELEDISGGRKEIGIFWVEVDRRDIKKIYERVIKVVVTLGEVGGLGKEVWVNLTGGNNVVNFALQLASTLSGKVARIYYVQAENPDAEKCVRFTSENGYWVELPVLPITIDPIGMEVIRQLEEDKKSTEELFNLVRGNYWKELSDKAISSIRDFEKQCLFPLEKVGIIAESNKNFYSLGPKWTVIKPYQELLEKAKKEITTIEKLAEVESWIERDFIKID